MIAGMVGVSSRGVGGERLVADDDVGLLRVSSFVHKLVCKHTLVCVPGTSRRGVHLTSGDIRHPEVGPRHDLPRKSYHRSAFLSTEPPRPSALVSPVSGQSCVAEMTTSLKLPNRCPDDLAAITAVANQRPSCFNARMLTRAQFARSNCMDSGTMPDASLAEYHQPHHERLQVRGSGTF